MKRRLKNMVRVVVWSSLVNAFFCLELLQPSRSPTPEEEKPVIVSPNFSLYTAHARQICQHIRELADLVLERRKSYLLTSVNVYGHDNFMTDDDRRQFDSDTSKSISQLL